MITSAVFIALIGTVHFKPAISAAVNYEPIKITVNENFNAQSGQVSTEFQSLEPGVMHKGANFYFKPRFNLPSSSIPHHIEALMSLLQQHHSCAKDTTKVVFEEEKLMEILMPFLYSKEALSDTVKEEKNSAIVVPSPILITEESKPVIPELEVIPEAPVLPPLSFNGIPPIIEEEVKREESVIQEESTSVLNEVPPKLAPLELINIPEAPVLPPLSANDIHIVEEVKVEEPITLRRPAPIVVDVEPKSATPNLLVIPEAPVLPVLSFNGMPSIVEKEVKKEELVILQELTDILPTKPAITVGPITEPIITYVKPNPSTSGVLVIPEAPVLPSLLFNGMPSFVEKEVKKEESIILDESTGESQQPTIIEVEPKPATPELVFIPEAPILPTLSANDIRIVDKLNIEEPITLPMPKPIFVGFESKPKTSELVVIPEARVLRPFSANDIRIVEEVKIEEPISLPMLKSIVVDIEPNPVTPELLVIPEAPMLPPLSFNGVPAFVEEEGKKEESEILKESTGVLQEPIISEVKPKPVIPEFVTIPGVLHSLSFEDIRTFVEEEMKNKESIKLEKSTSESQEPNIIKIEPKPTTPELEVIPEAPVLPPLSFNGIPEFVEEEVKKEEESVLLEESTGLFPKPTIIEAEPKKFVPQLLEIPEAPVLPPLSLSDMSQFVEKELKKEESIILEKSLEPTMIEIEPKSATPDLKIMPEAPVLLPLYVRSNVPKGPSYL